VEFHICTQAEGDLETDRKGRVHDMPSVAESKPNAIRMRGGWPTKPSATASTFKTRVKYVVRGYLELSPVVLLRIGTIPCQPGSLECRTILGLAWAVQSYTYRLMYFE